MSNTRLKYILAPFTLTLALTITSTTVAMPPHSQIADKIARGEISRPYYLQNRAKLLSQGLNSPAKRLPEKESVLGTYNALAILVEFSDKNSSVSAAEFDTLIFINRQGSVRHYYNEVSYSQLDIVAVNLPSSLGWQTAPQTYSYYCNGQNGLGAYPQNTQKLTEDLIDLVDAVVDFSAYDNDLDGYVDALIIVHAGPGAEYTGSDNDIWSHQWGIFPEMKDGVLISEYCIQPEYWQTPGDITCGVFCHELGHVFGLPDLYDTDNPRDAYGIGKWSLMSYGSWNGPLGMGDYPAHPDAWSRIQLGFTSYTNVASNFSGAVIPSVESGGNIYRLWSSGGIGDEYFLVENRQKTGYDSYLPSSGLLIWHIDEAQSGNDNQWYPGHTSSGHYLVALEQADGLYEMEKNSSAGNSGDPFPGSHGVVSFTPLTTPNSNSYSGENTYVAVTDISSSGATMTADFQVAFSADAEEEDDPILPEKISLSQNFPNPFNPSTNINIELNEGAEIQLEIFDILGRLIKTLADGYYPQGTVNLTWDGTNDSGQKAASGIYFYRLRTDDGEHIKKMTMLK
jgi:immune inhibitor A